jgi:hypothetical protein
LEWSEECQILLLNLAKNLVKIMRKLFLASAVVLFGLVNAQKNTLLVAGDISYSSISDNGGGNSNLKSKTSEFSFNPVVGYQFADNFTAGVKFGISAVNQTISQVYYVDFDIIYPQIETKQNIFEYGVFGRYTLPLSDLFSVYGDLYIFASSGKATVSSPYDHSEKKATGFGMAFTPNLSINLKNSFALNFNVGGIGFSNAKTKGTDYKSNQFVFAFGKGISVGISKNFKL